MLKRFGSFYKTVEGNEGCKCRYPTRLDTYGCGCAHDCKYCYAKSLLSFRNLWNPKEPEVASIQYITNAIRKIPKGQVVRLGGMTDCFQPIEKVRRNTYRTIQKLNHAGIGYLIVTKSAMVADDEYLEILDKNLAHIQITVTSTDDKLSATYEKASPPSERIKAIEKLQALGFDVAIRLSPFIPEYLNFNIINKIKCDKAVVEFLRANAFIKKTFDIDYSRYTINQGNYCHLPLGDKLKLIQQVKLKEVTVCEDEDNAYKYWRDHFNPNPLDCCNLRMESTR